MRMRRYWLAILGLLIVLPLFAADVPPTLEPWKDWVLKDQQWRECPLLAGRAGGQSSDYACTWLGRLKVDAQTDGANVALPIRVDARGWVSLPGDAEHWPQQATLDGRPVEVIEFRGPALLLEKGSYQFRAFIPWQQRPQSLRVPQQIALVTLSVDGKPILPLQRDGEQVTLGRTAGAAPEADSIELRVFRRLDDGLPATLTTQIELYVSGQAREEVIGPPLPDGFLPMALADQGWPARLDPDGRLRIQVQAGAQTVTLIARAAALLASVSTPNVPKPWPAQETWSYQGDPAQRVTAASAAISIDPIQAGVPSEWQGLPAFALKAGEIIEIEERSRGAAEAANRLTLEREAWLDFDGHGWFARDHIRGTMQRDWRFDVVEPFRLQRADNGLETERPGMLVTQGASPTLTGVEWRTPNVQLDASVRIEPASLQRPIAGWQQTFDRIDSTVHLPNGYRLIAAPGSDRADGSWIERWTLLDVFVAAMAVLLAFSLLGINGGALALVYLLLGYQELGAPLGLVIAALVLALLARVMPAGRLARLTLALRYLALGLLVLIALPFAVGQLRLALYPQLEGAMVSTDVGGMSDDAMAPRPAPPDPAPVVIVEEITPMSVPAPPAAPPAPSSRMSDAFKSRAEGNATSGDLESVTMTGYRIRKQDLLDSYDQSTVLQTGSGEAAWTVGSTANLSWSGPVLADQTVNLLIAPPWLVRSLRVLLVIALGGLLLGIARRLSWRRADFASSTTATSTTPVALLMIALIGALPIATTVHAQETPSENLLAELRARLIEPPVCAPNCATTAQATINAQSDGVSVLLDVHALDRVAVALPTLSTESDATLRGVRVDGISVDAFAGLNSTTLLPLSRGVQRVELDYQVGDRFDIAFVDKPHRVTFNGTGWQVSGISEDRLLGDTVSLARIRADAPGEQAASSQQFAPFVRVEREISLALDWSVTTNVLRLAPQSGGFTVPVPLMAGEHVNVAGIKVEAGHVNASIDNNSASTQWTGTLDKGETLSLTAPALSDRAEVWRVVAIPAWHVEFSGVPESNVTTSEDDFREFVFHPLPGETLTITVTRPVAVDGATRAIDRVTMTSAIGQRAATQTLAFTLRASQGGEQVIGVPADAEFISLTRNGETLSLRPRDGTLSLPLQPGSQNYQLVLREAQSISLRTQTPSFDLGLPLANIDFNVTLPEDRWLLATWGPGVGPAVLFWGELSLMVVLALLLSRWRASPLRSQTALLLVLGFSTYAWLPLMLVLAWLVAIDWREKRGAVLHDSAFNLAQVAFAALTLIAMFALVAGIRSGLLGTPDMVIAGSQSYGNTLHWFADRSDASLPQASIISLPIWIYRTAMLLWALWLAWAVTRWLRRAFAAWTNGGIWRAIPREPKKVKPVAEGMGSSLDDSVE